MTTWSPVGTSVTSWGSSIDNIGLKRTWGEWSATTWGTIMANHLTWSQMAGYTFSTGQSRPITIWS